MSTRLTENAKITRLLDAMNTYFAQILGMMAEMGIVSSRNHSVFVVYAHDNTNVGEADAKLVKKLIKWLKDAGVTILSDRSPWDDKRPLWEKTRGNNSNNPGRDILWNQMRLLPKCRYSRSADKVFLCCSEVLKKYDDKRNTNPDIRRYYQEIQGAYERAQEKYMVEQEMYDEIHEVIQHSSGDDFHHVLTELALLDTRKENKDTKEDESRSIIPVILNGDLSQYKSLPFLDNPTTIFMKLKPGRSLLERNKYKHDLFLKLLESLHSYNDYQLIKYFSDAYSKYSERLIIVSHESNDGGGIYSQVGLKGQSELEIGRVRQEIEKGQKREEENQKARLKSLKVLSSQRNPTFTGRYREFGRLFKIFFENTEYGCSHAALFSLGGIGKIQIALEIAYRVQERFPEHSVFWVQANDITSLEASYRNIAKELQLPPDTENLDIKMRVNDRLSRDNTGKWLMVVDSADDSILDNYGGNTVALAELLPSSSLGGILFTTRNLSAATNTYAKSKVITVDQMNKREAMALLKKGFRGERLHLLDDEHMISKLLDQLCMLPLAIAQAICYLNKVEVTIETYLKIFNSNVSNAIELLSKGIPDQDMDLPTKRAVATTWIMSFEQIEKIDPHAAKYLKCIAVIRNRNIPGDLLPDADYGLPTIEQMDALSTLVGFGFLKPQPGERLYDMHRLVHLVTRNWLENKNELLGWTVILATRLISIIPNADMEERQKWTAYLPHAIEVAESPLLETKEMEKYHLFNKIGLCQNALRKDVEAEAMFRKGLALCKKVFGDEHSYTLACLFRVGRALSKQKRFVEAEAIFLEELALSKRVFGDEHPNTLWSMYGLADAINGQERYVEAKAMHCKELALGRRVFGDKHPHTLWSISCVANTLIDQKKYIGAKTMHRKVLALRKKILGDKHPDTLSSLRSVALALSGQGKYDKAETIHCEVLASRKKVLGDEHPFTISSYHCVASALSDQRKYAEAETMHCKVLALRKKVNGDKHPDIISSLRCIGQALSYQGKHAEAETMYRKELALRKKVSEDEHLRTILCLHNIALALTGQRKYAKAKTMHYEVLALRKKLLGDEHPNTIWNLYYVASALDDQRKYAEAETMHCKVLALRKKALGDKDVQTISSYYCIARALRKQGKDTEAETMDSEGDALLDLCRQGRKC